MYVIVVVCCFIDTNKKFVYFIMKRAAIILKGAVGMKTGGHGNTTDVCSDNYVEYELTKKCIDEYIIQHNPDYHFDFYIHCWNTDLEESLTRLYSPSASRFEENAPYEPVFKKHIPKGQSISQISQALSIKKGIELMDSTNVIYDHVIITRPDVAFWTNIQLSTYHNKSVYVEEYRDGNGDMMFVMSHKNSLKFQHLYESTLSGHNPAYEHRFIKNYITTSMKSQIKSNIIVGKDIEVLSKVPLEKLQELRALQTPQKKTIFLLEHRGGWWSLYHFLVYNLGGLYYIEHGDYHIRHNDSVKLNDTRVVSKPSTPLIYPLTICLQRGTGPMDAIINEAFHMIRDRYTFIDTLPSGDQYEIISIYGEPCNLNSASNNPTNVFPFLRNLCLSRITMQPTSLKFPTRFFIGRKQSLKNKNTYHTNVVRTILNEYVFVNRLKEYKISCIYLEDYSFPEKIQLFNQAHLILSTNSSALTCLMWCTPSTHVIEILNKPINCGKGNHYKLICDTLGISYQRFSSINDDANGNFTIEDNSIIYNLLHEFD
jgi:hypothetical protein